MKKFDLIRATKFLTDRDGVKTPETVQTAEGLYEEYKERLKAIAALKQGKNPGVISRNLVIDSREIFYDDEDLENIEDQYEYLEKKLRSQLEPLLTANLHYLPENLTVHGDLIIKDQSRMYELPKGLKVHGRLVIAHTPLKSIPEDLVAVKELRLMGLRDITHTPAKLTSKHIDLHNCTGRVVADSFETDNLTIFHCGSLEDRTIKLNDISRVYVGRTRLPERGFEEHYSIDHLEMHHVKYIPSNVKAKTVLVPKSALFNTMAMEEYPTNFKAEELVLVNPSYYYTHDEREITTHIRNKLTQKIEDTGGYVKKITDRGI